MKLGFHVSIAGGFRNVIGRAQQRQCETIQLFTRNPRAWKHKPLDTEDISIFKNDMKTSGIGPVFVHMPYLVNLATTDKTLGKRSLDSLITDLKRSAMIDAPFLIMHIGSAQNMNAGLKRMSHGINRALSRVSNNVTLLLENTTGSGAELGHTFEQLAAISDMVDAKERVGFCFDTCHVFAAGYDLRTTTAYQRTMKAFDRVLGLERLCVIHLNDAKKGLGSRVDRHEHIGKGTIGIDTFSFILNDPQLKGLPKIIETPKKKGPIDYDRMNLNRLRSLISS